MERTSFSARVWRFRRREQKRRVRTWRHNARRAVVSVKVRIWMGSYAEVCERMLRLLSLFWGISMMAESTAMMVQGRAR